MRLFGLIGFPLSHSFSKTYFTRKFAEEGIAECAYELFPIESIAAFPALLTAHQNLEGINVTIPYKKDVIQYLSERQLPEGVEACNCIKRVGENLIGFNTDIVGFEQSFTRKLKPNHTQALILGNGGATLAVTYVLKKLGIPFKIVGRALKPGTDLTYDLVTPETINAFPIIINTSPVGTYPASSACPAIPYDGISDGHYLFDLVYNPSETLFMKQGSERGASVQNGYDMLLLQAEEAWRIWNM